MILRKTDDDDLVVKKRRGVKDRTERALGPEKDGRQQPA